MSKPIDQERESFAREYDAICSRPITQREIAWRMWQARAAVQPAGVAVPDVDPRDIAGDTGHKEVDKLIGRLTAADPDFDDCAAAAALLRRLVMEEISGPSGYSTWREAAVSERIKRVALKPNETIVQIAREGLDVYAGPNMNERKVCEELVRLAEAYAAPHPVSGEQKAQDVAGLAEAVRDYLSAVHEQLPNPLKVTAATLQMKKALAAHRAQQGEQP